VFLKEAYKMRIMKVTNLQHVVHKNVKESIFIATTAKMGIV